MLGGLLFDALLDALDVRRSGDGGPAAAVVRQHVGALPGFVAVGGFLVGEAGQSAVVAAGGAVRVAAELLGEVAGDLLADVGANREIAELHPCLVVAGAGLDGGGGPVAGSLHLLQCGMAEVVHQDVGVFAGRPDVEVVSSGVHPLEPRDAAGQFGVAPFSVHRPSGGGVVDADLEPLSP